MRTDPLSPKTVDGRLQAAASARSLLSLHDDEEAKQSVPSHRSEHFSYAREEGSFDSKISALFSDETGVKKRHIVIDPEDMPSVALLPREVYYRHYLRESI